MGIQYSTKFNQTSSETFKHFKSIKPTPQFTMESVKNAANYVGDSVNEMTSGASKEANKSVAKDDNASIGTRASAAKDAAGDKMDETKSSASAEGNKQAAKN